MPNSSPEWVQAIAVTVIVNDVPVITLPTQETAIGIVNRYSGAAAGYQVLCTWTVSALKIGQLVEVSMIADVWAKAVWKLVVGATTVMLDDVIQSALTIPFGSLSLAPGTVVTLSVHSDGVVDIVADGEIAGKEIG